MRLRHAMPFGAEVGDGGTRFRIWAPAAQRVDLELTLPQSRISAPMLAVGAGWYEARIAEAGPGTRYAFRIDDAWSVPDPASRFNPEDVHAPSEVIDPLAFDWSDARWRGRPWHEAVIYELHIGSFTAQGTFASAMERLDYLADLGVTALELMPIADFPGKRNWGYDGVLPFAPDTSYGTPGDLKRLVAAAHDRGLMMLLDVVYNHFGPEGNYLHLYAPEFFDSSRQTPWGPAIAFDGGRSAPVRDFFIHNALYWIEEYRFDGLRLDAVHAIDDRSQPDFVSQLCAAIRSGPGAERQVHIVLENDANDAHYLASADRTRPTANAQWNDDLHHAVHVLVTGERDGYYADYADAPVGLLGRCLAEGFGYQGEPSPFRGGARRGTSSTHLDTTAFVNFLQSHDQVGNRALGERISALAQPEALRAAVSCILLAPSIPMLFMGEEFGVESPFLYFCDFAPELARAVRDGRQREFASFSRFGASSTEVALPDPNEFSTFQASKLSWQALDHAAHRAWHDFYRELLALRQRHITPHLGAAASAGRYTLLEATGIAVDWTLTNETSLHLRANFSALPLPTMDTAPGRLLHATHPGTDFAASLPAWSVRWTLEAAGE